MNKYVKIKLSEYPLTLICMFVSVKEIIQLSKINKQFYQNIIPLAFIGLQIKIKPQYYIDSDIISDYRLMKQIYDFPFKIDKRF